MNDPLYTGGPGGPPKTGSSNLPARPANRKSRRKPKSVAALPIPASSSIPLPVPASASIVSVPVSGPVPSGTRLSRKNQFTVITSNDLQSLHPVPVSALIKESTKEVLNPRPPPAPTPDLDTCCGVKLSSSGDICQNLITCKLHSESSKRSVAGRKRPYSILLQEERIKIRRPPFYKGPLPLAVRVCSNRRSITLRGIVTAMYQEATNPRPRPPPGMPQVAIPARIAEEAMAQADPAEEAELSQTAEESEAAVPSAALDTNIVPPYAPMEAKKPKFRVRKGGNTLPQLNMVPTAVQVSIQTPLADGQMPVALPSQSYNVSLTSWSHQVDGQEKGPDSVPLPGQRWSKGGAKAGMDVSMSTPRPKSIKQQKALQRQKDMDMQRHFNMLQQHQANSQVQVMGSAGGQQSPQVQAQLQSAMQLQQSQTQSTMQMAQSQGQSAMPLPMQRLGQTQQNQSPLTAQMQQSQNQMLMQQQVAAGAAQLQQTQSQPLMSRQLPQSQSATQVQQSQVQLMQRQNQMQAQLHLQIQQQNQNQFQAGLQQSPVQRQGTQSQLHSLVSPPAQRLSQNQNQRQAQPTLQPAMHRRVAPGKTQLLQQNIFQTSLPTPQQQQVGGSMQLQQGQDQMAMQRQNQSQIQMQQVQMQLQQNQGQPSLQRLGSQNQNQSQMHIQQNQATMSLRQFSQNQTQQQNQPIQSVGMRSQSQNQVQHQPNQTQMPMQMQMQQRQNPNQMQQQNNPQTHIQPVMKRQRLQSQVQAGQQSPQVQIQTQQQSPHSRLQQQMQNQLQGQQANLNHIQLQMQQQKGHNQLQVQQQNQSQILQIQQQQQILQQDFSSPRALPNTRSIFAGSNLGVASPNRAMRNISNSPSSRLTKNQSQGQGLSPRQNQLAQQQQQVHFAQLQSSSGPQQGQMLLNGYRPPTVGALPSFGTSASAGMMLVSPSQSTDMAMDQNQSPGIPPESVTASQLDSSTSAAEQPFMAGTGNAFANYTNWSAGSQQSGDASSFFIGSEWASLP